MPFVPKADPPAEEEEVPRLPDEQEILLSWLEERFRELGFNDLQAASLAETRADWHEAQALLKGGCDHLTAVDLLT